jgi:hypothetical protein
LRPSLAPNPIEPIFGGHALSTSHAARCTPRHGVGSHAVPPTMECAIPTGKKFARL